MTPTLLLCLVVAITDGDTIKARCGQPGAYEQITVRISAIDAPESRQAFGQKSKQHLSDLCFHQQAIVTPKTTDKYGRTVGDVECQGRDVATEQVRAGMAWYYVKYGKGREQLQAVEQAARQAGRGLWSMHAEPPWEWRKKQTTTQGRDYANQKTAHEAGRVRPPQPRERGRPCADPGAAHVRRLRQLDRRPEARPRHEADALHAG